MHIPMPTYGEKRMHVFQTRNVKVQLAPICGKFSISLSMINEISDCIYGDF